MAVYIAANPTVSIIVGPNTIVSVWLKLGDVGSWCSMPAEANSMPRVPAMATARMA